ncbi:hypothetical protein EIP86_009997 [Pleurotus ostreatoroseus]|nr:hypothetical protein EIP86_009997 [Pleurotus ostreatoroseus]
MDSDSTPQNPANAIVSRESVTDPSLLSHNLWAESHEDIGTALQPTFPLVKAEIPEITLPPGRDQEQDLRVHDVEAMMGIYPCTITYLTQYGNLHIVSGSLMNISDTIDKFRFRIKESMPPDLEGRASKYLQDIRDHMKSDNLINSVALSSRTADWMAQSPAWLLRRLQDVDRRHVDGRLIVNPHVVAHQTNIALEDQLRDTIDVLTKVDNAGRELELNLDQTVTLINDLDAVREEFDRRLGITHGPACSTSLSRTSFRRGQTASAEATLSRDLLSFRETLYSVVAHILQEVKGLTANIKASLSLISSVNMTTRSVYGVKQIVEEARFRVLSKAQAQGIYLTEERVVKDEE